MRALSKAADDARNAKLALKRRYRPEYRRKDDVPFAKRLDLIATQADIWRRFSLRLGSCLNPPVWSGDDSYQLTATFERNHHITLPPAETSSPLQGVPYLDRICTGSVQRTTLTPLGFLPRGSLDPLAGASAPWPPCD